MIWPLFRFWGRNLSNYSLLFFCKIKKNQNDILKLTDLYITANLSSPIFCASIPGMCAIALGCSAWVKRAWPPSKLGLMAGFVLQPSFSHMGSSTNNKNLKHTLPWGALYRLFFMGLIYFLFVWTKMVAWSWPENWFNNSKIVCQTFNYEIMQLTASKNMLDKNDQTIL